MDIVPAAMQSGWNAQALAALGKTISDNGVQVVLVHEAPGPDVAAAITSAGAKPVLVETDGDDPVAVLETAAKQLVTALTAGNAPGASSMTTAISMF